MTSRKILLDADRVKELLDYDPDTGVLRWKALSNSQSRVQIGSVAGCPDNRGYIAVNVAGQKYKAHRLAWVISYGRWPEKQVDHINGVKGDNRLCNLREATNTENCRNAKIRGDSLTGLKGASPYYSRFRAQIRVNKVNIYLGTYDTAEEAARVYDEAAKAHFGEFRRVSEPA